MDSITAYHYYKQDFFSAYNNNGNNIKLALHQVSQLRDVEVSYLETILRKLINELKTKK